MKRYYMFVAQPSTERPIVVLYSDNGPAGEYFPCVSSHEMIYDGHKRRCGRLVRRAEQEDGLFYITNMERYCKQMGIEYYCVSMLA